MLPRSANTVTCAGTPVQRLVEHLFRPPFALNSTDKGKQLVECFLLRVYEQTAPKLAFAAVELQLLRAQD
jgi:hypothetical protein